MKNYSLKKCRSIFFHVCKIYRKKQNSIEEDLAKEIKIKLSRLKDFITIKDKKSATIVAKELESILKKHLPLSTLKRFTESFVMLTIALFFAIIIRQTCFELMTIPTGSMRPTFKESDKLIVSKTQFGINIPLKTKHFFFSPKEIKRMGTVVFSADGLDIPNANYNYFYIFPGVKKFVKRMIGLPGDTLYFYGGKIYGIDKDENDITNELQQANLSHIEHIPYININGNINNALLGQRKDKTHITFEQNHIPVASLYSSNNNSLEGEVLQPNIDDIHKIWGMGNFGMTRILPCEKLYFSQDAIDILLKHPESKYFLEITHHASIKNASYIYDYRGFKRPSLKTDISYIPLSEEALKRIWNNMYTSRFYSNKGYLEHFGKKYSSSFQLQDRPKIKGRLEDGTYEFFNGIAYKVKWQPTGFLSFLPLPFSVPEKVNKNNPLAKFSASKCVTLYNMGIEQSKFVANNTHMGIAPSRYAYFRDGDLYLMGAKIFSKNENTLQSFVLEEKQKQANNNNYVPFIDEKSPLLADGSLDIEKIKRYGLQVPKNSYYVLGDNHAQSGDSREFGFVPEDNIRGTTTFLFWAPGGRFGAPLQTSYPWFSIHKFIVWAVVLIGLSIYFIIERRKHKNIKNNSIDTIIDMQGSIF